MICPYCNENHSDEMIDCPTTRKRLKKVCTNKTCSYYGEYIFPLDYETCPCCGKVLVLIPDDVKTGLSQIIQAVQSKNSELSNILQALQTNKASENHDDKDSTEQEKKITINGQAVAELLERLLDHVSPNGR